MKRVRWLLDSGNAHVNQPNTYGMTPLHLAAMKGHTELVAMLCTEFHADIHQENAVGQSALHVAKDRRVQHVLKQSEIESKRRRNEERERKEKRMRDALLANAILREQRVTFRSTTLAKQIEERLRDPVNRVANEMRETMTGTARYQRTQQNRDVVEEIARKSKSVWTSSDSRLRHARRVVTRNRGMDNEKYRDTEFYRSVSLRPDSRHFVDCVRGAGWSFQ